MPEMLARSLIGSAMAAFLSVAPAAAQNFPNRPIAILVPYSPGGPTDTAARVLGEHMAVTLGQNMVVENLTGGGGTIATGRAARATPDGYTLLLHQLALAANVTLLPNQPYDTEKELTGVGLVNFSPMVLVGRNTLPVETMAEMTAWMKLHGPDVKFAHAGSGTLAHLCAALLAQSLGIKVTMIPYRGGTPAVTDILAGHSDIYCSSPLTAMEQIKGKLIKAFAVTSPKRMATLPDVPSAVALGYKDLDIQFWQGLYVAAGTPKPVVERLNNALRLALADPKVVQSFTDTGMSAFPIDERTPEAATVKLRDEIKRWGEVIRANNIVAAP
jgi:tripartite-type tricarboxylate transporter receptor subunit TctC